MTRLTDAKSDVPGDGPAPGCELSVSYLSGLIGDPAVTTYRVPRNTLNENPLNAWLVGPWREEMAIAVIELRWTMVEAAHAYCVCAKIVRARSSASERLCVEVC